MDFRDDFSVYFASGFTSVHGTEDFVTTKNHIMEQLNRIELRGNVGSVRISTVGTSQMARFSLATNFMYKTKEGEAVVETTWHNVVAWSGKGMPDFNRIGKGSPVYVCGRLKSSKYTAGDGTERQIYEVIANRLSIESDSE